MMQHAFSIVANQLEGIAFQTVNAQFNFVFKKIPKKTRKKQEEEEKTKIITQKYQIEGEPRE